MKLRLPARERRPAAIVVAAFVCASLIGIGWGLPGTDSWASDSISPRSTGLGAILLSYESGRFHLDPPLHMAALTLLSLPFVALAAARAGSGHAALEAALLEPRTMTGMELVARAVSVAMAAGVVWNTMRLWTRLRGERAGVAAGVVAAANGVLVYYAHTGNLEAPYLFWVTCALVEIDRIACGEARESQALLCAAAAVLTKDQAAAAFVLALPIYVLLVPWRQAGIGIVRAPLFRGVSLAVTACALVSGAIVNPLGFSLRIELLLGPAREAWARYPATLAGRGQILRDAVRATTHFTSWPIAIAALAGIAIAVARPQVDAHPALHRPLELARLRALLPLLTSLSFLLFVLVARRTEDRFLLPVALFFFPYSAVVFDGWWGTRKGRPLAAVVAGVALLPALIGVASVDGTLLGDARYAAERFLASLPPGTRVEVLGGAPFLPRIPRTLAAARPGTEPEEARRHVPGLAEIVDLPMDPRPRAPDYIVLATDLGRELDDRAAPPGLGLAAADIDPASRRYLARLFSGAAGYHLALRARCALPRPLVCRRIHESTGEESWIFRRDDAASLP